MITVECNTCKRVVRIEAARDGQKDPNPGHGTITHSVMQCVCGKYL